MRQKSSYLVNSVREEYNNGQSYHISKVYRINGPVEWYSAVDIVNRDGCCTHWYGQDSVCVKKDRRLCIGWLLDSDLLALNVSLKLFNTYYFFTRSLLNKSNERMKHEVSWFDMWY